MRCIKVLGALTFAGIATAGCSQITVTSDTIVNGTSRLADATTNAARATSDATTNASNSYAQSHSARRRFVASQYDMLKREAARGEGEDLDTLAYMMSAEDKQAFGAELQSHYASLFSGHQDASAFLSRLYKTVGIPPDMQESQHMVATR